MVTINKHWPKSRANLGYTDFQFNATINVKTRSKEKKMSNFLNFIWIEKYKGTIIFSGVIFNKY